MERPKKPTPRSEPPEEGHVHELGREGDGVVRTARGVVMVRGAFPGDHVRLRQVTHSGGALRADRFELVSPSPSRNEPACEIADACGGCAWMRLSIDAQREAKKRFVARAVHRVAPDVPIEFDAPEATLAYRRRARLAFVAPHALGYRAMRTNRVIHVPRCVVLAPALDQARAAIARDLLPALAGRGEIQLGIAEGDRVAAIVRAESAQLRSAYAAAEGLVTGGALCGIALHVEGTSPAVFGETAWSAPAYDGTPLRVASGGFTQAQDLGNAKLVGHVVQLAEVRGAIVLELYAGYGNLTVALARDADRVTAVELDAAAADACRFNLRARNFDHVRVEACDARDARKGNADVVVLDPPRAGAKEIVSSIASRRPKRVVYVSCDTATLERDLVLFREHGLLPDRAVALDLFPHTAHIESIVRLVPRSLDLAESGG